MLSAQFSSKLHKNKQKTNQRVLYCETWLYSVLFLVGCFSPATLAFHTDTQRERKFHLGENPGGEPNVLFVSEL